MAEERPVAKVTIFQNSTVGVVLAFAVHRKTTALALAALVVDGARVTIIAGPGVELRSAPAKTIAKIVSTWIVVVADNGQPGADASFAVVTHGTRVTIRTLTFREDLMIATRLSHAGILGTGVIVITRIDVVPLHCIGFVDLAIAIVVDTVA